jgi:hypothetical protein
MKSGENGGENKRNEKKKKNGISISNIMKISISALKAWRM